MDNDLFDILYNYFDITLRSYLNYSDVFEFPIFPISPSPDLITFNYKLNASQFSSILYHNKDIVLSLKSNLIFLFQTYYENLDTINLIFSPSSFSIKLNFIYILPKEIYGLIAPYLPSGRTIESWSKVNKYFGSLITRQIEDKYTNHLWTLIKLFPDKPWDWRYISSNPNITWKIIRDNPDKPWSWRDISRNPNITMEIIRDNPNKLWSWKVISINPNITWWMVRDNLDKPWDWRYISSNPNITMEIIRDNPDKEWDWWYISSNPNITTEPYGFLGTYFL